MLNCYRCIYAFKSIIQPRFFHYIPSVRRSRRSYLQIFVSISFPENFASFTAKYQCRSLFFNKVGGFRPATLSKRDSNTGVLCEICEIHREAPVTKFQGNSLGSEIFPNVLLCSFVEILTL